MPTLEPDDKKRDPNDLPPAADTSSDDRTPAIPVAAPPAAVPTAVGDPVAAGSTGPSDPAAPASAPQTRAKTKGAADVVFLIDVSGSMAPIIDALRKNIEAFVETLSAGGANNAAVRDWRGKVAGYRDIEAASSESLECVEDHPFVRNTAALKAQLASLGAQGGGDEPESLLDALYKVATMEATRKGSQSDDPGKWRYRGDAVRGDSIRGYRVTEIFGPGMMAIYQIVRLGSVSIRLSVERADTEPYLW